METESSYNRLADDSTIIRTFEALERNGIHPYLVNNKEEAKTKLLNLIPPHQEVMNMTSVTLAEIGIENIINDNLPYISVKNLISKTTDDIEKRRLGSAQEWAIGSVHAVTEDGNVIIASATGSQLPAYAYGASNIIWVVGTQKIVKDISEGFARISEYVYPLENERALKAYGMGSGINKILIVNKETIPGRIHMIFVKEKLGF